MQQKLSREFSKRAPSEGAIVPHAIIALTAGPKPQFEGFQVMPVVARQL